MDKTLNINVLESLINKKSDDEFMAMGQRTFETYAESLLIARRDLQTASEQTLLLAASKKEHTNEIMKVTLLLEQRVETLNALTDRMINIGMYRRLIGLGENSEMDSHKKE